MISVEDYQTLLEKRHQLQEFFDEEFENLANNADYRRKKCIKKCQKETEHELYFAINVVWRAEVKAALKCKDDSYYQVIKPKKENKLLGFIKKVFRIKSKAPDQLNIEETKELITEESATKDEISTKPISTEIVDGQMDIEELEDGEIYEE